jgi:hypothetical protein
MKRDKESKNVSELLAQELHRQYRATAKAMGVKGPEAHDHGVRDCGTIKFNYFIKRANLIIKRASCNNPKTLGQAEENLNALILARRVTVYGVTDIIKD